MPQPMSTGSPPGAAASPLRAARQAQGLTLDAVAAKAGIHKAQLSRFERGESGLSLAALYRLARVLEVADLTRWLEPYAQERAS